MASWTADSRNDIIATVGDVAQRATQRRLSRLAVHAEGCGVYPPQGRGSPVGTMNPIRPRGAAGAHVLGASRQEGHRSRRRLPSWSVTACHARHVPVSVGGAVAVFPHALHVAVMFGGVGSYSMRAPFSRGGNICSCRCMRAAEKAGIFLGICLGIFARYPQCIRVHTITVIPRQAHTILRHERGKFNSQRGGRGFESHHLHHVTPGQDANPGLFFWRNQHLTNVLPTKLSASFKNDAENGADCARLHPELELLDGEGGAARAGRGKSVRVGFGFAEEAVQIQAEARLHFREGVALGLGLHVGEDTVGHARLLVIAPCPSPGPCGRASPPICQYPVARMLKERKPQLTCMIRSSEITAKEANNAIR